MPYYNDAKKAAEETREMTVYPNIYFGLWDCLTTTCPLDAFNGIVQAYYEQMASAGLVKIDCGYVTRLLQPVHSDFAKQLKMYRESSGGIRQADNRKACGQYGTQAGS